MDELFEFLEMDNEDTDQSDFACESIDSDLHW